MRRRVLVVLSAFPLAIATAVYGCSSGPPIEDYCAFLRDPGTCYSSFHKDLGAACGFADAEQAKGAFGARAMLDVCILTKAGGQVVFDPPLDVTAFPPMGPIKMKFVQSDGVECGSVELTNESLFTLIVNPPPGAADAGADAGSVDAPLTSGTIALTGTTDSKILTMSCPSGTVAGATETHTFNDFQLMECAAFAGIAPRASLEANLGAIKRDGFLRLKIQYPPANGQGLGGTEPANAAANVTADVVTYFDCTIPGAPPLFQDGIKNGGESDVDCGGPADANMQPPRCLKGQACRCNNDCDGIICGVDPMSGAKKCGGDGGGVPCQ